VRSICQTALKAELAPLLVVTGAHQREVQNDLQDLPVLFVHNPDWQSGQSSSIKAGVRALLNNSELGEFDNRSEAAILLLADQPQVTQALLRALVECYHQTQAAIIAPWLGERRGNPVLFKRSTFADLLTLQGDVGGRALFKRFPVLDLPWDDPAMLLDVDTPQDYERLKEIAFPKKQNRQI